MYRTVKPVFTCDSTEAKDKRFLNQTQMKSLFTRVRTNLRSRILLTGAAGLFAVAAQAQAPDIVQATTINATPPLYSNGSFTAHVSGGVAPFNFTLTNVSNSTTVQTGELGGNKAGFTRFGNHSTSTYYRSTGSYGSYNDAANAAASQGGYLLSINSAAENQWLVANGGWAAGDHLGGTDQNVEGVWQWHSGEAFSYTNWSPGEPNNGGGIQDYMQIYANGTWDDIGWNQNGPTNVLIEIPNRIHATGLFPGDYQLSVTGANNQTDVLTFSVGPQLQILSSASTNIECGGTATGSAVARVIGGAPPYTYEWSTGASGNLPQELDGFTMLGEFGDRVYYISDGGFPSYAAASAAADNYLGHIASINSSAENTWLVSTGGWTAGVMVGGNDAANEGTWVWDSGEPWTYSNWAPGEPNDFGSGEDYLQLLSGGTWNDIPWLTNRRVLFELAYFTIAEDLPAGDHTLTITDSQGVEITQTFTITQPAPMEAVMSSTPASGCGTNANGSLSATVTGGAAPYSYAWSNGANTATANNLTGGNYTLTVTDANNCQLAFNGSVDGVDSDGPSLNLQALTVQLNAQGAATLQAATAAQNSNDDCDNAPEYRLSLTPLVATQGAAANSYGSTSLNFDCDDEGNRTVYIAGIDNEGNASVGSFTVNVRDNIAPTISVSNGTLYLDASGEAEVTQNFIASIEGTPTDNCGIDEPGSLSNTTFNCSNLGENASTYSITDRNGNTATANLTIQVVDTIKPSLSLATRTVYLNANGIGTLSAAEVDHASTDNCGIASRSISKTNFSCEDLGEQFITFTATDASGNSRSQQVLVVIADEIAPDVEVQNVEIAITDAGAVLSIEDVEVLATDNCGIASKELSQTVFTCTNLGENEVVYTVTDLSGNVTERVAIVTVIDAVNPIANPTPFVVELTADGTAVLSQANIASGIGSQSSDNCASTLLHEVDKVNFDCNDLGPNTVTYTVTDLANNSSTAEVTITVVDPVKPNAQALGLTIALDEGGTAFLEVETADNNSYDNCSVVSRSLSKTSFDCSDLGQQVVALTAIDQSGNSDIAWFMVTVVDQHAPTVDVTETTAYLGANGWAQVSIDEVVLATNDNCGVTQLNMSQSFFHCNDAGAKQVMVSATDAAGNLTQVQTTVLVVDTLKPTLSIDSYALALNDDGFAELTPAMLMTYANDNCGVASINVETPVFECVTPGQALFTEVTVTDVHGNVRSLGLDIVITDAIAPVVSAQDVTLMLNEEGVALLTEEAAAATAYDNCGVVNSGFGQDTFGCADINTPASATFMAVDASGNATTTTINVTVIDNLAPVIVAPLSITLCSNEALSFEGFYATDNCDVELMQTGGPADGQFLEAGNYLVTFEAIDAGGNTAEATVAVEVLAAPEVDLGEDQLIESGNNAALDAGAGEGYTYLWSTGETTQTIKVEVVGTETYTVTVTAPNGCQTTDTVLVTNDPTLSTNVVEVNDAIAVYPNPTTGELSVNFDLLAPESNVLLTITDMAGRTVEQRSLLQVNNGDRVILDLRHLADGSYIVNVRSDRMNLSQRILKH